MPSPSFILRTSTSLLIVFFFFNDTATTEIYTLSLHDALPISDQYTHDSSATVRNRKCLLQNRDCFFGLAIGNERESKKPEGACMIREYCQYTAQLMYRFFVAVGLEQDPPNFDAGNRKRVVLTGTSSPGQRLLWTPLT